MEGNDIRICLHLMSGRRTPRFLRGQNNGLRIYTSSGRIKVKGHIIFPDKSVNFESFVSLQILEKARMSRNYVRVKYQFDTRFGEVLSLTIMDELMPAIIDEFIEHAY